MRFYDQQELLPPSQVSEAGYRLYTDQDLVALQQILSLKFLGFSLDEIKLLRRTGPPRLREVLAQQKAMMLEKHAHLADIIRAIEETERALQTGLEHWDALVKVIQAIQMDQDNDWTKKYLTPEQREQMARLSEQSYSDEARRKLAARGAWTEADQQRADEQWAAVTAELKRLTASGADPAGAEAQALMERYNGLISAFTGGDPDVLLGLENWWNNHAALPEAQRPFQPPWGKQEGMFLDKALAAHGKH